MAFLPDGRQKNYPAGPNSYGVMPAGFFLIRTLLPPGMLLFGRNGKGTGPILRQN